VSIYKPKGSPYYHYDFWRRGRRYCGSTECGDRREAERIERDERERVRAEEVAEARRPVFMAPDVTRSTQTASTLLTPREAAARLRCSYKQLARLRLSGALKYVQVGLTERRPRWRVSEADLEEFIARHTRRDTPPVTNPTPRRRRGVAKQETSVSGFAARLSALAVERPSR